MNKGDVKVFAQCDRGSWTLATVDEWSRMGMTGRRFKTIIAAMPREQLRELIPNVMRQTAHNCVFVWAHPIAAEQARGGEEPAPFIPVGEPRKTTINLDVGPSPEEFAAKCEKLSEPAQRLADVAKGVFCSTVSIPASQVVSDIEIEIPPPSVHQLQTELADLRAKLRYASVRVPEGFWQVEGLVSSVKGRETPGHQDRMAYIDGVKGRHVTDALSGPSGFIITSPCGVAFSSVVHIIERDPGRKYQPWPEKLTFSVST